MANIDCCLLFSAIPMKAKPGRNFYVTIFAIAGILIISLWACSIKIMRDIADVHAPLVDAAMEMKLELALTHLKFEQHIANRAGATKETVLSHLRQVQWYARAMLSGDRNSEGVFLPLADSKLRNDTITTIEKVVRIQDLVQAYFSNGRLPHKEQRELDRLFKDASNEMDAIEDTLLAVIAEKRTLQKNISYSSLALSTLLLVAVLIYYISNRRFELGLIRRLNKESTLDELTGINNRRSFNAILSSEWNRAQRAHYSLSLVMCDIDFFKQYNDELGHQAGDECLRVVAEVMQSILQRPVDTLARYGGEEFVFIFPFTDANGAAKVINRFFDKLRLKKIIHPKSEVSNYLTVSAGVASLVPDPKHTIEELISAADDALYRAKAGGRNCITQQEIS